MCAGRPSAQLFVVVMVLGTLPGCASLSARWTAFLQCCAEERALKAEAARDDLEALKAELETERKAIRAERELDLEAVRADCEKRNCQARSQFDESVRTKLALDVDQQMTLGQVQVNLDELERLLAERDRRYKQEMAAFNEAPRAPFTAPGCEAPTCCPSCGAPQGGCDCETPPREALSGNDCAGTLPFRQEPPRRPVREPLLPTEIPLMLPVKLKVGFTNANLEDSRVRRTPRPGRVPLRETRRCEPCGQCSQCRCGKPCTQPPTCVAPGPVNRVSPSAYGKATLQHALKEPVSVPASDDEPLHQPTVDKE